MNAFSLDNTGIVHGVSRKAYLIICSLYPSPAPCKPGHTDHQPASHLPLTSILPENDIFTHEYKMRIVGPVRSY